ncbi:MAG TPA: hypothetical protein VG870_14380, partial [Chitinophagaceae bacterium]|nr:hypothetical protein [Chitinophagaceae bacterium]
KETSFEANPGGSSGDYFPRTVNSNWSYQYDGNPNDSLFITVISPTVTVGGNTYSVFIQTADATKGYDSSGDYRRNGGDYYEWTDVGSFLGFSGSQWSEVNFLKDNLAAGGTWTSQGYTGSVQGVGTVTIRLRNTILQKDVPVTVNSIRFDSTIVVEQRLEQNSGGNWVDLSQAVGSLRSYYAKNIGLVQQELYNGSGTLSSQMQIRRYQVIK